MTLYLGFSVCCLLICFKDMKSGRAFSAAALPGLGIKICELFHRAWLVSLELISELTTEEM